MLNENKYDFTSRRECARYIHDFIMDFSQGNNQTNLGQKYADAIRKIQNKEPVEEFSTPSSLINRNSTKTLKKLQDAGLIVNGRSKLNIRLLVKLAPTEGIAECLTTYPPKSNTPLPPDVKDDTSPAPPQQPDIVDAPAKDVKSAKPEKGSPKPPKPLSPEEIVLRALAVKLHNAIADANARDLVLEDELTNATINTLRSKRKNTDPIYILPSAALQNELFNHFGQEGIANLVRNQMVIAQKDLEKDRADFVRSEIHSDTRFAINIQMIASHLPKTMLSILEAHAKRTGGWRSKVTEGMVNELISDSIQRTGKPPPRSVSP